MCRASVLSEGNPEYLKEEQDLIKQIIMNEEKTIEAVAKVDMVTKHVMFRGP